MSNPPTAEQLRTYASDPMAFFASLLIPVASGPEPLGRVWADFQRERLQGITPSLQALVRGEAPPCGRFFWEGVKGTDKSGCVAYVVLWLLCFSTRPLRIEAVAADKDQASEFLKSARDILHWNPWLGSRIDIQRYKIVCEANGSEAEVIAADIHGAHGSRPDVLIIDELHAAGEELVQNKMDNASKMPRGLVIQSTNAGFRGTWQYRWREQARLSDRWTFHRVEEPPPWIDEGELEEARRRNSNSRFLRLWRGVWSSGTGDALDADDISAAVNADLAPMERSDSKHGFVAGLDLGVRHDHAAMVVLGRHVETRRLRLARCENFRPSIQVAGKLSVDLEAVEAAVLKANRDFRLRKVCFDPYQAALMAQRLQRHNVTMQEVPFSGASLNKMASVLLETFRGRSIDLYHDPLLQADLERLTIVEKSYGYKLESARDDQGHADRAIALAIALPFATTLQGGGSWGGVIRTNGPYDRPRPVASRHHPFN